MRNCLIVAMLLATTVLPLPSPVFAQAPEPGAKSLANSSRSGEIFAGIDSQQGDYGTGAKVETVSTSVGVAARKGRLRLAAAIPYLRTTAPADVVVSQGGLFGTPLLASGSNQTVRSSREGLGDATVQAAYDIPLAGFTASLGGGLKLPTASRVKGLGTGKVDYAITAQVARPLRGGITPFAALGYTMLGKPDGFLVRNTLSGTAGMRIPLLAGSSAALSYSYEQSASKALADRQSAGVGLGVALRRKLQIGLQGEAGLSRGAPELKLGLRLGAGF
jgi:hypothetical protein